MSYCLRLYSAGNWIYLGNNWCGLSTLQYTYWTGDSPALKLEPCRSLRSLSQDPYRLSSSTHLVVVVVNVSFELGIVYPCWKVHRHYPLRLEDIALESRNEARKRRSEQTLVAQRRGPYTEKRLGSLLVECEGICYNAVSDANNDLLTSSPRSF